MSNSKNRDTFTYELKQGNKIVYIAETNDIEATEQRHKDYGKKFTKIVKTSNKMTKNSAQQRETENLERYRRNHKNKNTKYNEK